MKKKRFFVAFLLACLMAANTTALAAEPVNNPVSTVDENVSTSVTVDTVESSAISRLYPSGQILGEKTIAIDGKQMYEVAFATESGSDTVVLPRNIYGYAAHDAHSSNGSFTVYAPGSATLTGGLTMKTSGFTEGTPIYMSVKRPDGTYAVKDVPVPANTEVVKSFTNAQPGTYTCFFTINGSSRGQLHLWVY